MEAERWRQIDLLFAEALERPPAERPPFLDAVCGGDSGLRQVLEELLAMDREASTFLERPLARLRDLPEPDEEVDAVGTRLGPYTLVRLLGRGGMGVVYRAVREDGQYERQVAVKILRHGLAGAEPRRRFFAERQILARLEHPHIARLYDGGTTADGRPYLVMEYVEGLPIDVYCDRHRLGIEARADLLRRVCAAVQHAHQHLLVHRDLKPGNILVTAAGEPKLLDFGIAKQLAPGAPETRTGLRVMTPRYASPEQVRSEPVTTASDIYSLGVIAYELLAGCRPYRTDGERPLELERAVCEEEPERPSAALDRTGDAAAVARARGTHSRELRRRLRGDLDTIVLAALRKEPSRRYGSAAQLAEDLLRWRRRQPVTARRDSFGYRAGLFLRRHRWAAAAASVTVALLAVLLAGLFAQREHAARERDKARHALAFLVDVFKRSDPYETGGERLTARQILEHGTERVSRDLAAEPEIQAALLDAIGQVYLGLGMPDQAEPLLTRALERRRSLDSPLDVAASLESLANLRAEQGRFEAAAALHEQALAAQRRLLGTAAPQVAGTLNRLADLHALLHRDTEAEALHRQALEIYRRSQGEAGPGVAETLAQLARLARDRGAYGEAGRRFREAIRLQRRALGPRHPTVGFNLSGLALVHLDQGDPRGAEALLREALAIHRQSLEAGHPDLVDTLNNLAVALYVQGKMAEAEEVHRETLAMYRRRLGDGHPRVAASLNNLGAAVLAQGRPEEAARLHREALAIRRRVYGERHLSVAESLMQLGRCRFASGRLAGAEDLARRVLEMNRELLGDGHPLVAYTLTDLGKVLMARRRPAEAEAHFQRSLEIRSQSLPADHFETARSRSDLGECLALQGRHAEAEPLLLAAWSTLTAQFPAGDKRVRDTRRRLAALYRAWGMDDEARRYASEP